MEVLGLALCLGCFLRLQSTAAQTLPGSCIDAGYTTCCEGSPSNCPGQPPSCFCDSSCHEFSDCCQDIDQLCPALPPPPKPLLLPPTRITFHSATVQWICTNSSTDRSYTYLVNYHTGDSETNTTAVNVTEHLESGQVYSSLLGGLVPGTTYTYSVIAVNTPRRSARSEEAVFTTFEHPVVRHVSTEVLSTTSVRVTWSALDLPSGVRVTHYCVHYSGSTVPPQEGMQVFPAGVTCGEVGGLIPHTTYLFHVVGTIMDIDGSVSQESSPDNGSIIFVPDTALFQLRGGPLAACDDWNAERERGLSTFFQFVTARAISSRCGCVYQNSLITGGSLLCEAGTPVYATYRANLTSTENCTAGTLLRCVEDWVAQGAAAQGPSGSLITLNNNCPVSIRLRSAPLCRQPGQSNTSAPRTETCVSIPILAATLVAELLFIAAVVMVVTLAALLVISNKGKRSISSGQTLEPSTQHEAMPNVYERGQPSEPPRQQMYLTGSVEPPRRPTYEDGQTHTNGIDNPPAEQTV